MEQELPVTADTLFAIGSNTKSFTATLLAMQVDDGALAWDTPIREVLPEFRLHDPVATAGMTAVDLLSHRSGLPRHDLYWYATGKSRPELVAGLRYLEPSASFRGRYQYQNLMFLTAGVVSERIGGKPWEELVEQRHSPPPRHDAGHVLGGDHAAGRRLLVRLRRRPGDRAGAVSQHRCDRSCRLDQQLRPGDGRLRPVPPRSRQGRRRAASAGGLGAPYDPYSHLLAQALLQLDAGHDIEIATWLVTPPADWASPARAQLDSSSLVHARRLAAKAGLHASGESPPSPEATRQVQRRLAATLPSRTEAGPKAAAAWRTRGGAKRRNATEKNCPTSACEA